MRFAVAQLACALFDGVFQHDLAIGQDGGADCEDAGEQGADERAAPAVLKRVVCEIFRSGDDLEQVALAEEIQGHLEFEVYSMAVRGRGHGA